VKRIAVSQRVEIFPEREEVRDALDQRLVKFIEAAGGLAFPVPNVLSVSDGLIIWLNQIRPDAVVLGGGNDIGESGDRDLTELALLTYAESWKLPVLGICRGMQMIGHWSGALLKPVSGHVRCRHRLKGEISGVVNSYHKFALAECPNEFKVLAESEDGELEAIRHVYLPWEGWMWHPEREDDFVTRDVERLRSLVY